MDNPRFMAKENPEPYIQKNHAASYKIFDFLKTN
jgi:hypothetical protein